MLAQIADLRLVLAALRPGPFCMRSYVWFRTLSPTRKTYLIG